MKKITFIDKGITVQSIQAELESLVNAFAKSKFGAEQIIESYIPASFGRHFLLDCESGESTGSHYTMSQYPV